MATASSSWLLRIPGVFPGAPESVLAALGLRRFTRLGSDYFLIPGADPGALRASPAWMFVSWNLRIEHSWPCHPRTTDAFIEKAAQALFRKFGARQPQAVLAGALDTGSPDKYFRTLASNLRGRTLQLFPRLAAAQADDQDPGAESLFCLVGKEGLFAGLLSPRDAGGFHPGGTKFIRQDREETISRAGAKIAEGLHWLRLHRPPPAEGSHWLELGASPGGMTSELLARGYRVTAVDRAPLDARLTKKPGLTFVCADAATFRPRPQEKFDALLSDLNGDGRDSLRIVLRLLPSLKAGGLVVFTLKTPGAGSIDDIITLCGEVTTAAEQAGLPLLAKTHLTYNRQEFTLFFEKR